MNLEDVNTVNKTLSLIRDNYEIATCFDISFWHYKCESRTKYKIYVEGILNTESSNLAELLDVLDEIEQAAKHVYELRKKAGLQYD